MFSGFLLQDVGSGEGKSYAVNFPLKDGIDDESYRMICVPVSFYVCMCVCEGVHFIFIYISPFHPFKDGSGIYIYILFLF